MRCLECGEPESAPQHAAYEQTGEGCPFVPETHPDDEAEAERRHFDRLERADEIRGFHD